MSSQKGNVSRSRGQKHQNTIAYKNDKYGATALVKKANAKVHDGLCQRCTGVLEWKVKYNKYKPLTQAKKCVRCSQKTVKDAYYIICKPCSLQFEICCKCGKKEDIVVPINSHLDKEEEEENDQRPKKCGRKKDLGFDSDDDDLGEEGDEDLDSDSGPKQTQNKSLSPPDVSEVTIKD